MSIWRMKSPVTDRAFLSAVYDRALTPHGVFEHIRSRGRQAVLLESGGGGDGAYSGWTFVCAINEEVKVPTGEAGLFFMRDFLRRRARPPQFGAPPFTAGFVGFLSYDLGEEWITGKSKMNPESPGSSPGSGQNFKSVPEAFFVYTDEVFAFQNVRIGSQFSGRPKLVSKMQPLASGAFSNLTFSQYCQKIRRIKQCLYAGQTYQVNFSQRFEAPYGGDAFELYKKLTALNPSPFQFFMENDDFAVISNSPERLFRIDKRIIETRPIKGTVPRGRTPEEDERNIRCLLASEKDRAELAMIVDLERNDVGKLCVPGTVEVTENRTVEKYSHVIHTVANISGLLEPDYDWYDGLTALFPGGSVTGCPKKRTMEIIRELEDEPRGVYCGSAGYIDLSGGCDFNIMIRTIFLDKSQNQPILKFRSGGGIVADSDPQKEYEESLHKAEAILTSINRFYEQTS